MWFVGRRAWPCASQCSGSDTFGKLRQFAVGRGPRAHLLSLVAVTVSRAGGTGLSGNSESALLHQRAGGGASYTDINATLPLLYMQVGVTALVAVLAAASLLRSKNGLLWAGLGSTCSRSSVGWLYPAIVQRFSVAPNELAKETPYIHHSIAATRKAFALDKVEERELSGETALTAQDIQKNQQTIKNIRLWDQQQLLDTFAQIQEIRTYYDFKSVDNDRYRINGELRQVMLSARELSSASLPTRNWINEHLTYTHGFGLTLGPVNQVTPQGQPVLYIKDIPPASSVPSLKIERPEIYFGELSNDRVYVKTNAKEFDYSGGRRECLRSLRRRRRRRHRLDVAAIAICHAVRRSEAAAVERYDAGQPRPVRPQHQRAARASRALPEIRQRPLPGHLTKGGCSGSPTLTRCSNRYPYSQPVERRQLHPQFGQGGR